MAQKERIEFRASSDFVDRLEELSASMKVSKAEVIRAAIDTLEMVAAADREGKGIAFVPKESNTKQEINSDHLVPA
jgi:predicted transcriptional regulator